MTKKNLKMMMLIKERDWTLNYLAELTSISRVFLSKIQNGHQQPSEENAKKIADALQINVNELFPIIGKRGITYKHTLSKEKN